VCPCARTNAINIILLLRSCNNILSVNALKYYFFISVLKTNWPSPSIFNGTVFPFGRYSLYIYRNGFYEEHFRGAATYVCVCVIVWVGFKKNFEFCRRDINACTFYFIDPLYNNLGPATNKVKNKCTIKLTLCRYVFYYPSRIDKK